MAPVPGAAPEEVETALTRIRDLEHSGNQILYLQRDLTRTIEDVEDVVNDLLRFTAEELDEVVSSLGTGDAGVQCAGG